MGNAQASNRGALAQFYADNGADVGRALHNMGGPDYVARLCSVFQVSPAQMGATAAAAAGADAGAGVLGGDSDGILGGDSYVGGFSDMQNYGNSLYSKAKERLIRNIAGDVFAALKAKGAGVKNVNTAPIGEVVSQLVKALPPTVKNPRKFPAAFNSSSSSQKSVCHALANAINKHYTGAIISLDSDENTMCTKIAEVMGSLITGLHTEFMNVAGDVLRVMSNMQLAQEYLDRAYRKQKDLIMQSADPRLRDQSAQTDKVYDEIKSEYNRQSALLANLMNISVGPTGKSLISSLEDNRDFVGTVRNLKAMVGTSAFGDKLATLLSGISSVAHSAELIDKALKKIGMTAAEFRSASNASELRSKVFRHISSSSPTSKRLDEMMHAARIIYEADYDHAAISKALGKSGGDGDAENADESDAEADADADDSEDEYEHEEDAEGNPVLDDNGKPKRKLDANGNPVRKTMPMSDANNTGEGSTPMSLGGVMGGVDDDTLPTYWRKKTLGKKIKNKEMYRNLVLKDFRKQLQMHIQQIVESANGIGRKIGSEIPITDDLKQFIDLFGAIPSLDEENLHVALSGYPKDSTSKEKRDLFMLKYDAVVRSLEPLQSGPNGALFKTVSTAIRSLLRTIDDFSDKMVRAITEIHLDRPEDIAAALRKTASAFYGAGDSGEDVFGNGNWVALDKVKAEMLYYYSIANVKSNLARSNDDLKSYADDYDQLLGEEAAWLIDRVKRQYLNRIENVDAAVEAALPAMVPPLPVGVTNVLNAITAEVTRVAGGAAVYTPEQKKETAENFKSLWTFQMNAKVNMIKVAQAIDLYMKAFTDGISKHPDAVSSVVKMLNGVEIVAKWFNDRSGDQLASLFDVFPNAYNGPNSTYLQAPDSVVATDGSIKIPIGDGNHYYQYLERQWADVAGAAAAHAPYGVGNDHMNLPGNPALGRHLNALHTTNKQCKGIIMLSQKVIKSMRALENILSAFSSVGSRFGDVDPMAKTFMTPGQIFNHLCEYVAASAFTTEFAPNTGDHVLKYQGVSKQASLDLAAVAPVAAVVAGIQTIPTNRTPAFYRPAAVPYSLEVAEYQGSVITPVAGAAAPVAPGAPGGAAAAEHGVRTGVGAANQKNISLALSGLPGETAGTNEWTYHNTADAGTDDPAKMRVDLSGWRDNFFDTDQLFQMTVKSIVAKVLTVVDAYRLFNRPVTDRRQHYSLNPLRSILGGNESGGAGMSKVKVIPDAMELYYRLLLLAEWYRENFGLKTPDVNVPGRAMRGNDAWRVAIVPSIDGIWSDLVNVVFDSAEYVKDGNYTETQVQRIILAINNIWSTYKSKYPKSTVRGILNAFVLEMNRAFGFLRQTDINDYLSERRKNLGPQGPDSKSDPFLDFDILNANDQFGSRPAPSDRFTTESARTVVKKTTNMMFLQKAIEDLRKKIDVDFLRETRNDQANAVPFAESLRNFRTEMNNAKTDTDEYKVVLRMLQGSNRYINVNADKMVMVHEAIAAPLVTLYAVYKVLARFNAMCHGCSLNNLAAWNEARGGVPALNNGDEARAAYAAFLGVHYSKIVDAPRDRSLSVRLFTRALVGNDNGGLPQGYLTGVVAAGPLPCAAIDSAHLAKDLLSAVLSFGTNPSKLVTVAVGSSGVINMDFSALEELCRDLHAQVKENVKKLRVTFNPTDMNEVIDRFEDIKNIGSTRWLEENMFQQLFADRDETGLTRGLQHMQATLTTLGTRPAAAAAGAANNIGDANAQYASIDDALRGLVFYEHAANALTDRHVVLALDKFPGNVIGLPRPAEADEKKALAKMGVATLDAAGAAGERNAVNAIHPAPVVFFENAGTINTYDMANGQDGSLLRVFNKLLHMFIYTSVEDGANKIYGPLLETFATSAGSLEVIQAKAFPNVGSIADGDPNDARNAPLGAAAAGAAPAAGVLHGPPDATVVYASNAVIIRSLLNSVQAIGLSQKKRFLFDTLAEVPEYLKDRLRVNLPYFSKLFDQVAQRATMLKQLLSTPLLRDNMPSVAVGGVGVRNPAAASAVAAVAVPLKDLAGMNAAANVEYLNGLLTRFIECGHTMRKTSDLVYRELQDRPLAFFETSKDFLSDFRSRNGGSPFMPYSSILTPLTCLEGDQTDWKSTDSSHLLMPVKENGSSVYKFNSAARLLLGRGDVEPTMDHFPGAKDIYNSYVSSVPKATVITPAEFSNTVKHTVRIARFLMDGMVVGRLFQLNARGLMAAPARYSSRDMFQAVNWSDGKTQIADLNPMMEELVVVAAGAAVAAGVAGNDAGAESGSGLNAERAALALALRTPAVPLAAGAVRLPLNALWRSSGQLSIRQLVDRSGINGVVELTENMNVSVGKSLVSAAVGKPVDAVSNLNRNRMRVLNILDAGIVPLNVHAFMREVPFVNLLNYSYTFDRMVHDFVLPSYIDNRVGVLTVGNLMLSGDENVNNTRSLLVKLLVHPYADLKNENQYFALLGSLFNGNDSLKLGRPRYLSDQLWHKALLTSSAQLVAGQERYNMMGIGIAPANRYAANSRSEEGGPTAYEAMRQSVRYANPNINDFNVQTVPGTLDASALPVSTNGLKYWNADQKTWSVNNTAAGNQNNMASGDVVYCAELGRVRFDTKLTRNLVWFVNLQRIMRVVLTSHLSWINTPVVRGLKIADNKITEYNSNDKFDDKDFTGENYQLM